MRIVIDTGANSVEASITFDELKKFATMASRALEQSPDLLKAMGAQTIGTLTESLRQVEKQAAEKTAAAAAEFREAYRQAVKQAATAPLLWRDIHKASPSDIHYIEERRMGAHESCPDATRCDCPCDTCTELRRSLKEDKA